MMMEKNKVRTIYFILNNLNLKEATIELKKAVIKNCIILKPLDKEITEGLEQITEKSGEDEELQNKMREEFLKDSVSVELQKMKFDDVVNAMDKSFNYNADYLLEIMEILEPMEE